MAINEELDKIFTLIFGNFDASAEYRRLIALWEKLLKDKFLYQEGPYPAGHGEKHIENVLLILGKFLVSYRDEAGFTILEKCRVFAAAMIHDINMIAMRSKGASGHAADDVRRRHARLSEIKKTTINILREIGFTIQEAEHITEIASSHAGDDELSADQKLDKLREREGRTGEKQFVRSAILLQVSDFFDIGPDRLTHDVEEQEWDNRQILHYKKHAIVRTGIKIEDKSINLYWEDIPKSIFSKIGNIPHTELFSIIYAVFEDAEEALNKLNKAFNYVRAEWHLLFDKTIFGEILPMGEGLIIFKKNYEKAYSEWVKTKNHSAFPIDLMGHSLFGRFVSDEEGFNKQIKNVLINAGARLRVLLLDPGVENQQMCEVFDAQLNNADEKGRAILPLYNDKGEIINRDKETTVVPERGDILNALEALKRWTNDVGKNSSLEVRATTRLMYMSICRFGDTIIVTPYRRRGLLKDSVSLLFKKGKSPLYDAHVEVFEDIWKSQFETTLQVLKDPAKQTHNLIHYFLPERQTRGRSSGLFPLDYERFLLETQLKRIKTIFDNISSQVKESIPPFEMEIQPSEECTFHCSHCIGRHLSQRHGSAATLTADLSSLFKFKDDKWKIERFRISGLLGDPLSDNAKNITLDFLNKAKKKERKVVILTNGLALNDRSIYSELLKADCIHVSLDASTPNTFHAIKGVDSFKNIVSNIDNLCSEIRKNDSKLKVGIGFVVTQGNAHEVTSAIDLAKDVRSNFIRFKPDIRGVPAISWRTWKEAEAVIKKKKKEETTFDVIITDAGWSHYRLPAVDRCWAQYFYTTLGADNNIYPCDHLTANGHESVLGALGIFENEWEKAMHSGKVGHRYRACILCPPSGWRLNRLVQQLYVLYKGESWDSIEGWVTEALKEPVSGEL